MPGELPRSRRSIRLPGFDYRTPAGYFVTVCVADRAPLFGTVRDGQVLLSRVGEIVREEWFRSAALRANLLLLEDELVVMPNHVHGILWLTAEPAEAERAAEGNRPHTLPGSVGAVVGAYKAATTRRINQERGTPGARLWQRNYWERIIRSDRELEAIRRYIAENPARWEADSLHPAARPHGGALDFLAPFLPAPQQRNENDREPPG